MTDLRISAEMWYELVNRVVQLERGHAILVQHPESDEERAETLKALETLVKSAEDKFRVNRDARVLSDGSPVPADASHTEIDAKTGQQKDYVILSDEERAKGFIRPLRTKYRHLPCGELTNMALSIAETLARDPKFYSGGFCAHCKSHFPNEQFVWPEDHSQVGS